MVSHKGKKRGLGNDFSLHIFAQILLLPTATCACPWAYPAAGCLVCTSNWASSCIVTAQREK